METTIQSQTEKKLETFRGFLSRHMTAIDIIAGVIIALLVMGMVFVYLQYRQINEELSSLHDKGAAVRVNTEVLGFTRLFIEKVLKADGEIDFDTRLNLESAVRGLNDQEVFDAWQRFTGSLTERQAQDAVKDLLGVLVSKIQ